MAPYLLPGANLIIDRHYNSLYPYRSKNRNIYAVHNAGGLLIRYIEPQNGALLLRPQSRQFPLTLIGNGNDGSSAADQIIGRICHVSLEL